MYRGRFPRPQVDERERFYEREHMYERERAGYERVPHYDERAPVPEEGAYHKVWNLGHSKTVRIGNHLFYVV